MVFCLTFRHDPSHIVSCVCGERDCIPEQRQMQTSLRTSPSIQPLFIAVKTHDAALQAQGEVAS